MNMVISVYGYGRGGKYAYMFRYTYAGIRDMKMQMEEEDRHMSKVMCTSIGTVTQLSIKLIRKRRKKTKGWL